MLASLAVFLTSFQFTPLCQVTPLPLLLYPWRPTQQILMFPSFYLVSPSFSLLTLPYIFLSRPFLTLCEPLAVWAHIIIFYHLSPFFLFFSPLFFHFVQLLSPSGWPCPHFFNGGSFRTLPLPVTCLTFHGFAPRAGHFAAAAFAPLLDLRFCHCLAGPSLWQSCALSTLSLLRQAKIYWADSEAAATFHVSPMPCLRFLVSHRMAHY